MKPWESLFSGRNGIIAQIHELFGTEATIIYRTSGTYNPATNQQTMTTREVSVTFLVDDQNEKNSNLENAQILPENYICGTVSAAELDVVPVINRDSLVCNGREYTITKIKKGYANNSIVVYKFEGHRN